MKAAIGNWFGLLKAAGISFWKDDCPRMAAALSYYTVFSLPALLVLIVAIAGMIWDEADIRASLTGQMGDLIGTSAGTQIGEILETSDQIGAKRGLAAVVGILVLIFGATGAFIQLQDALNDAFSVEPDPRKGGIRNFILKRVFSFGMILGIAFLLLVSLAVTAAIAAVSGRFAGGASETIVMILNFILTFGVVGALFSAMFKVLPDAEIDWRDAWVGGAVTTVLFMIGKYALAFYLGKNDPGSAFGAAGSLAVIFIWIYYASMIVLFGAEFTKTWAKERGGGVRPENGAVKVVEEKKAIRGGHKAETLERK
jgi:membrane protein